MEGLSVHVEQADGQCRVILDGELDIATVGELKAALEGAHGAVVVDCARLAFIDASGVSALVELKNRNGSLALQNPSSGFRRLLDALQLSHLYQDTQT